MKGSKLIHGSVIFLVAVFLVVIYIAGRDHGMFHKSSTPVMGKTTQAVAPKPTPLEHVFIILEENKEVGAVIGNSDAPYINSLAKQYATANNYYGVTHPSLPNYLALTSGSTNNVTTDCTPPSAGCELNVTNIADEIEKSGRTWKEYAESMPSDCYAQNVGEYATKHNPFVYYTDIVNNAARCQAHVVPFTQLATDLQTVHTTPGYAFITPNLCSDMHDCSVAEGNNWLAQNVPTILNSKAFTTQNSLLVITWDEGDSNSNHVPTILIGPNVKKGYRSNTQYDHYALLHTIESEWSLQPLTANDKQAPVMSEFFTTTK
jgi:phosphatidylinositol-3-phosphatase